MAYYKVTKKQEGGGQPTPTHLYSFDQSQGGVWINTYVDVSDIQTLRFVSNDGSSDLLMRQLPVSSIVVYTGGTDVYTTIFSSAEIGAVLNVRIYNDILWVSFNIVGPSSKVVDVYSVDNVPQIVP